MNKPDNSPLAPVILYHTSFLPYLPFSLWQNQRTNPDRELILIGDRSNRIAGLPYRHEFEDGYRGLLGELYASYHHMCSAHVGDEQRALGRWFVLSEFLRKNQIEHFYFLDSDFLLFDRLSEWEADWERDEMIGTPLLWGFSFLRSARAVHEFCQWVLRLYQEPARREAIRQKYASAGSGLAEMGLMSEFFLEAGLPIRNVNWRNPEARACFDDGFFGSSYRYHPVDFRSLRQRKVNGPIGYVQDARRRRLHGIHFIGHQKNQIPGFTGWSPVVWRAFFRPNYRRNMKWLLQYLWNGQRCRSRLARQSSGEDDA